MSNWLTGQAKRVTVTGVTSDWGPVTTGVPKASILGPGVLNILSVPDVRLERTLSKFADATNLGGAADFLKGREALQRGQ